MKMVLGSEMSGGKILVEILRLEGNLERLGIASNKPV